MKPEIDAESSKADPLVTHGGVSTAIAQAGSMSEIVRGATPTIPIPIPKKIRKPGVCECGRTSSSGCFHHRCSFPGPCDS